MLASHSELPKLVGTIATYIVYDTVTQCFGEPCPGQCEFAGALHTAIKKGRGVHTFSCGRRCPAGADEGMRCAPWPANCPHPAVPARPRKRGSPRSPREKERRPRRVCNSTVKRANNCQDLGGWWRSRRRRPRCSGFGPGASLRSAPATQASFPINEIRQISVEFTEDSRLLPADNDFQACLLSKVSGSFKEFEIINISIFFLQTLDVRI